jgi:hypothetical protein
MIKQFNPLLPDIGWRQEVNSLRKHYKNSIDYDFFLLNVHKLMLDVKHHRIRKLSNYERTNLKEWGENWMRIWTFLKNNDYMTTHPDIHKVDYWQYCANMACTNLLNLNPKKPHHIVNRLEDVYTYWHAPKVTAWSFERVKNKILRVQIDSGNGVIPRLSPKQKSFLVKWCQLMNLCCDMGIQLCFIIKEEKYCFEDILKLGIKSRTVSSVKCEILERIEANYHQSLDLLTELKELDSKQESIPTA